MTRAISLLCEGCIGDLPERLLVPIDLPRCGNPEPHPSFTDGREGDAQRLRDGGVGGLSERLLIPVGDGRARVHRDAPLASLLPHARDRRLELSREFSVGDLPERLLVPIDGVRARARRDPPAPSRRRHRGRKHAKPPCELSVGDFAERRRRTDVLGDTVTHPFTQKLPADAVVQSCASPSRARAAASARRAWVGAWPREPRFSWTRFCLRSATASGCSPSRGPWPSASATTASSSRRSRSASHERSFRTYAARSSMSTGSPRSRRFTAASSPWSSVFAATSDEMRRRLPRWDAMLVPKKTTGTDGPEGSTTMDHGITIGIDLSDKTGQVCVLDATGEARP